MRAVLYPDEDGAYQPAELPAIHYFPLRLHRVAADVYHFAHQPPAPAYQPENTFAFVFGQYDDRAAADVGYADGAEIPFGTRGRNGGHPGY